LTSSSFHKDLARWFANNINTNKDIADMWIHESFTYSENLFLDYHYGKEAECRIYNRN
jgi:hypothetical protein